MSEERELRAKIQKGDHAERILNDPAVSGALERMRQAIYHNIATSHPKSFEEREDLYKMLRLHAEFIKQLQDEINGKKKAESRLEQLINKLKGK